ncbi:CocE/NonD family hydrolase [Oleiagrimonas sp.]|jgi:putative CocE/NonD family hydrolase|uniref:CocE/NonD family hydrolase n=1 Tax=Oleiagrimonas sp. TaxID=2010330 RepID=UPI002635B288|nr:CocE/NonD family hydrolase [Oleiagrimonas sp.]MDA3912700.1 CocE/NonD family hydrolase [Oleiagrimonas sp.]
MTRSIRTLCTLVATAALMIAAAHAGETPPPKYPSLPSETPAHFTPNHSSFNYTIRDVMIPMRDGVKLHTVIMIPKGAHDAPILLTRTPYNATSMVTKTVHDQLSGHMGSALRGDANDALRGYDNAVPVIVDGGYIRVIQDVRGKYGSEGDFVMNRPFRGPLNHTPVDESTDTYDTIDWLVKNLPQSNGKVGILGISYDGYEPLTAMINPNPALKVVVPMNPMVDGWMGDDWFHNGAFREQNMPYVYEQEATRDNSIKWWTNFYDDYDLYMHYGSAGAMGKAYNMDQIGFWKKITEHPAYDSFWRDQAMDKILAKQPLKVPVMLVDSLWDQEDIYGAIAVYKAIEPKDTNNDMVYLVMGPWHHGQEIEPADHLGAIRFGSDTGTYFMKHILAPFLAHYLKDSAPPNPVAPVTAYRTGTNHWERLSSWPEGCASGCSIQPTPLYLHADGKAGFAAPTAAEAKDTSYVSDPAKPVPFRTRPIQPSGYDDGMTWSYWLVDDQRPFSGRTDVVTFETGVLDHDVTIAGQPKVHLVASTSGTDSDWVVKLIDVYPDQVAAEPKLGGYQLGIAMDIFRGRYRTSFEHPHALKANAPLLYRFELPTANHVFRKGHRIMVQVQSSWFPLYDRNPQTYVKNIFFAKPADYVKATQRIYHAPGEASYIDLPLVEKH